MTKQMMNLTVFVMTVFVGGTAMAGELVCSSHRNAPAYNKVTGQWSLKADVKSDFTLLDLTLKNRSVSHLGGETERTSYDRRESGARTFKLKPDIYCNYELMLPRDFSKTSSFEAKLVMTCDNMFDATATLTCTVR